MSDPEDLNQSSPQSEHSFSNNNAPWVPLHVHSQYSILDASPSVQGLAKKAKELGMSACALTDHGNLYGVADFAMACQKEGIAPIIGSELYVAPTSRFEKSRMPGQRVAHHLILLAKNETGYHNLCRLSSQGFTEGFYYYPRVDKELLEKYSEGLICLSACLSSEIAQVAAEGSREELLETVRWYRNLYGEDFYLELQRQQMSQEDVEGDGLFEESWLYQKYESFIEKQSKVNEALVEVAKSEGIKLVATNDSHYLEREDWKAHEVLLNVQSGEPCEIWERDSLGNPKVRAPNPKRRTYASHELYFKSPEQMAELFADLPEAIANTVEIAEKCTFAFDFNAKHYPIYVPPKGEAGTNEEYLQKLCDKAIPERYTKEHLEHVKLRYPDRDPMEVVRERLDREMSVIVPKGMCDYLLIVWDFIDWAKRQGIPVGPGRGSGAGSIILYLIGVTDIEPLRFDLFFERFINPERLSYPDIDVDICMERRGEVIDYTVGKYGKDNVAQIVTFGTMKARMALRDVGRVLNIPLAKVDAIAKLVPEELNITIDRALDTDPDLYRTYQEDEEAKRLIDLAQKLEGCIRNTGIHAAGVIVSGSPLTDHIPVCVAKDSEMAVTQFAMKPVEKVGMLKIDFLGLKTLTSIQQAIGSVKANTGREIDPLTLPLDDSKAFELLNQGQTQGVFQMESAGMQEVARQLHVDRFEEIIAVVALYRPGPMEMIPSFCARKHGTEEIDYDHPLMEEILKETYGIMVYQEQVMAIAQTLAKYSLGEGDVLRRAMGKKIVEEMASQREKFRQGAVENGLDDALAVSIFDKIEKFASYGFNKSHAASYGFLTYVTAYLKANYPREWMAALMTCDRHDITKTARWIRECQHMEIAILPPDVNEASGAFEPTEKGIRFAMTAIKGVGTGVVEAIVEERSKSGPYIDLHDFVCRVDAKRVGKKAIECLVDAGCFDFIGWTRDQLRASVEPFYDRAAKDQKEKASGVMSLFSLMDEEEKPTAPSIEHPSTSQQILTKEKELLGFFLTGHPMDEYKGVLEKLAVVPLSDLSTFSEPKVIRTAFIVETLKTRIANKSQRKFAILVVGDGLESFELPIWSDLYEEKGHMLAENQLYYAVMQIEQKEGSLRLTCRWFIPLNQVDDAMVQACDDAYDKAKLQMQRPSFRRQPKKEVPVVESKTFRVTLDPKKTRLSHVLELKKLFRTHSGETPVVLDFQGAGQVHIDATWGVTPNPQLLSDVKQIASILQVGV